MKIVKNIRHVGIVVDDPEICSHFWMNVLGLSVISDLIETGPIIDSILGFENAEVRTIKLSAVQYGTIELLHFRNPRNLDSQMIAPNTRGITHIALEVNNLEENQRLLEENGVKFFDSIKRSVDGKVKVMYARGPENIIIEFVEVL